MVALSILPAAGTLSGLAKTGKTFNVGIDYGSGGYDLALKYMSGWSTGQRADALSKTQLLTAGDTVVMQTTRGSTSARTMFQRAGGTIPSGSDIDHIIDLQLGGADSVRNMWPLNSSVNRSLGAQIQQQIKNLPPGTVINRVTIGDR